MGKQSTNELLTTYRILDATITNADVDAAAAIAGSKLQALVLGTNAGVLPSTGLVNAHVAAGAAFDFSKLATLASAKLLVGNGSNVPTAVDMSGDITIDNAGATTVGAKKITSAKLDDAIVKYAEVEISSAEILALFTTPKELVAAPGAGKVLELISLQLAYDYLTTAYTVTGATNLQVKYTDASGAAVSTTQAVTGMIDQATDQLRALDKLEASVTPVVNAALVLTLAGADPTLGVGTIHAKVAYRVHATGL